MAVVNYLNAIVRLEQKEVCFPGEKKRCSVGMLKLRINRDNCFFKK